MINSDDQQNAESGNKEMQHHVLCFAQATDPKKDQDRQGHNVGKHKEKVNHPTRTGKR